MDIYVAGSSKELHRAAAMMRALRMLGHRITYDWSVHVEQVRAAYPDAKSEADLPLAIRQRACREDMLGVIAAERLVLLAPPPEAPTRGAWVELGVALATRICGAAASGDGKISIDHNSEYSIWVAGTAANDTIFTSTADQIFLSDRELLAAFEAEALMEKTA